MSNNQPPSHIQQSLLPRFGSGFLEDHAKLIVSDPKIALVELVANASDAGSDRVDITWPDTAPSSFAIRDNGMGMTYDEFERRWLELNYNRLIDQGEEVTFPSGNQTSKRKAFGRNGKGRHSVFCFANEYVVETWKGGFYNKFSIKRAPTFSSVPFQVVHELQQSCNNEHGTLITADIVRNHLSVKTVRDLIGSKFVADPTFKIYVNNLVVNLIDLAHLSDTRSFVVPDIGTITVRIFDSKQTGRTSKQHGVAWWVNKRLVGEPSWRGLDDEAYLDARTVEAKRYTFVVEADPLVNDVSPDWSEFKETAAVKAVRTAVKDHILGRINALMKNVHRTQKKAVIRENLRSIHNLPPNSRHTIGAFVDGVQKKIPTIEHRYLSAAVDVLANLEKARSGYRLIEQLARLKAHELDKLSNILDNWSVDEARAVLGELEWRLKLIKNMERLLEDPSSDELHKIQPLFDSGLWIFGPEYEAVSFMSNRRLLTVVSGLLGGDLRAPLAFPNRRPDFVALPDATLNVYSSDSYDERSEVNGVDKVLIVELKRGGFEITRKERFQAETYAAELQKSGKVEKTTSIVGFVLGTTLAEDAREDIIIGNIRIIPRTYSTVLAQAHARTFHLLRKIREINGTEVSDPDVDEALGLAG